jgi:hypothetical protein
MGSAVNNIVSSITGSGNVTSAANAAAEQQRQAALTSANISAFRPVGMTTRFGTSQFTREIDPATGVPYISSAGYTAAPELAALQNQLFGQFAPSYAQAQQMAGQYAPLTGASNQLFNLGQQYLATSPEQAAADYMTSQQGLLAPAREQQLSSLRNQLFQTGRTGLATGGTTAGGRGASNPELQAYYNAIAQQDAALAAQAQQAGMQRAQFGAGLYGTGAGLLGTQVQGQAGAYAPLQTQLGLSGQVENMAQQPYQLGLQLGTSQVPGQTAGAQMYNQGQLQAANTQYQGALQAQQMNNQFLSSLIGSAGMAAAGGAFGGGAGGMSAASGFNPSGFSSSLGNLFGNPLTAMNYGTNIGSQQTRMLAAQDF